jgi:Spy/CpxP family protein refolding chaperone
MFLPPGFHRTAALFFLAAFGVILCVAAAQLVTPPAPPPDQGRWWKNSETVRELQLSEAQVGQIEETFLENRLKLIDLRAELERQEARLQPLLEPNQPDEAKAGAQIDLVLAARNKLEKANAMMMLSIRRILTFEQWKKLQQTQQRRQPGQRQKVIEVPFGSTAPPPRPPEKF